MTHFSNSRRLTINKPRFIFDREKWGETPPKCKHCEGWQGWEIPMDIRVNDKGEDVFYCSQCEGETLIAEARQPRKMMSKWIYRYIRADFEEIDMGPYSTKKQAAQSADEHHGFGAITSDPIEVDDDYKPYKGTCD